MFYVVELGNLNEMNIIYEICKPLKFNQEIDNLNNLMIH